MTADRENFVKCLVPISGGKDSQVCLELAIEQFGVQFVRGLFCDTQFEHPINYKHIEFIRHHYNVRIDVVTGGNVLEKCEKYGRFPGSGARHCTDELKIRETKIYATNLAREQGGFEIWYGMRIEESTDRKKRYRKIISAELYEPHEFMPSKYPKYMGKLGIRVRLPIVNWSAWWVLKTLNGRQNPLYQWFDRVGCFPCQAAGDEHKEKCYAFDDFGREQRIKVFKTSQLIGKPMFTSLGGASRNPDTICGVCSS